MKAVIIGATGYGGLELIRLLHMHPQIDIAALVSSSQAGMSVSELYPHLTYLDQHWQGLDVDRIAELGDLIFFATPAGVSGDLAPAFLERGKCVIDLSGDFRLAADIYQTWYQRPPAPTHWQEKAVYGLSEWIGREIETATLIANPGCFATASLLALLPLLNEQLIDPLRLSIDGKTGTSGAGRQARKEWGFSEVNETIRPYRITGHQHIPEMERYATYFSQQSEVRITFVPHVVPVTRGITVTVFGEMNGQSTKNELIELYRSYYGKSPFVRIFADGIPQSKQVQGSNFCDIGLEIDNRTGHVIVVAAIDNLVKGAAGQAIQNANRRIGLPQECGLLASPIYP